MKKLLLLPVIVFACGISLPAQTLKIFHKSHAGTAASFNAGDFDVFGISPDMIRMQEEANRKREEEEKKKEEEAKRLEKEKKLQKHQDRKEEKQEQKEQERDARGNEDTPLTDPPAQEQTAPESPTAPASPGAPTKPRKKSNRQVAVADIESSPLTDASQAPDVATAPAVSITAHEQQRQHRMGWLFGIMGLSVVPTLVVASGAFSRRNPNAHV
jgi:hypothetical protein